ncbi:IgGFc-binding protein-like [Lethenteron reissneri]|uniref:IgGFc-binding protein-like n=1 Tax=Lethenteron reissneri TaxID=7753 RepID=UPI002AB71F9C|nr:IgGFc-binding protein-like [Lethenteron reissneri]
MRLCLALAALFLALGTTSGSHFRGGTISWIHGDGNQVKFSYMLAWRRSSMTPCTDDDIVAGTYFSTGDPWQCTQGCSESRTMNIACIEQNTNSDWMVGKGTFNFTVPATQQSIISFASCCWVPVTIATSQGTYDPASNPAWSMITVLNPGTRSDTGSPNISPMTTSKPLIKLKVGCTTVWSIPVLDSDKDVVKCRYANKDSLDECGSICGVAPFGTLDGDACTVTFSVPTNASGLWALALMIEDFPRSSITMDSTSYSPSSPLSSIPLQVIFEIETGSSCSGPFFTGVTPLNGKAFQATQGVLFKLEVDISLPSDAAAGVTIVRLGTIAPIGVQKGAVKADAGDPKLFHTALSWTPGRADVQSHQICFYASDSNAQETELRCVNVVVEGTGGPIAFSYDSITTNDFPIEWTITFSDEIVLPTVSRYFRFWELRSGREVYRVDGTTVTLLPNGTAVRFTTPSSVFGGGVPLYVTVDEGAAMMVVNGSVVTKSNARSRKDWVFTLRKKVYAECYAVGDPHYSSFDGRLFDYMGTRTFVLASNCLGWQQQPTAWRVLARNEHRGRADVAWTREVHTEIYGHTVSFLKSGAVRLDGQAINLPYYEPRERFRITSSGGYARLTTDAFFSVEYDGRDRVVVSLLNHDVYWNGTCGVCGLWNGDRSDDFTMPDHSQAPDAATFGNSWEVPEKKNTESGNSDTGASSGAILDAGKVAIASGPQNCGQLRGMAGTLAPCFTSVDAAPYFADCVFDMVLSGMDAAVLCRSLEGYAAACNAAGFSFANPWRNGTGCAASCGAGTRFSSCAVACPATCYDPAAPAGCADPCVEGCECADSTQLWDGDRCVPPGQCGCRDADGRYYKLNEAFWRPGCAVQCTCASPGSIQCQPSSCPLTFNFCGTDNEGVHGCHRKSLECTAWGDPHYITFDGRTFDFMGTYTYVLTQLCSGGGWSVQVKNEFIAGSWSIAYTRDVFIELYHHRVHFGLGWRVYLDGVAINVPYYYSNGSAEFSVIRSGNFMRLWSDFKLEVLYDGGSHVVARLPTSFNNALCGLCSNMNGNPGDDFVMRDGTRTTSASDFGNSWKITEAGSPETGSDDAGDGKAPDPTDVAAALGNDRCGMLNDSTGPFAACAGAVDPRPYVDGCVFDLALQAPAGTAPLCRALSAYHAACVKAGVALGGWRNETLCPSPVCPGSGSYSHCASPCPATCARGPGEGQCTGGCVEGCVCDAGYLLEHDRCVRADQCGCISNGKYYKLGDEFISDDCRSRCVCEAGELECDAFSCPALHTCGLTDDGKIGCNALEGHCQASGDPHYVTFDGAYFDFMGTCAYTLAAPSARYAGSRLSGAWRVLVENEAMGARADVSYTRAVEVRLGNHTRVRLLPGGVVQLNGETVSMPALLPGATVVQLGSLAVLSAPAAGLTVKFDGVAYVDVGLKADFAGAVEGLCGNYDGDAGNDFTGPGGERHRTPHTFGNAWQSEASASKATCEPDYGHTVMPGDAEKASAEVLCDLLRSERSPFAPCFAAVPPQPYFANCAFDLALSTGTALRCSHLQGYFATCLARGVLLAEWRAAANCPLTCPARSAYSACAPPCPPSCGLPAAACPRGRVCAEGCVCDAGFFLQGGTCVAAADCGCTHDGVYRDVGKSWYSHDCSRRYRCRSQGVVAEEAGGCHGGEACFLKEGRLGCHPAEVALSCEGERMSARIPRVLVLNYTASDTRLNDPTPPGCSLVDDGDFITFDIGIADCGAVCQEVDKSMIFSQTVMLKANNRSQVITRNFNDIQVLIKCVYDKRKGLAVSFTPDTNSIFIKEEGLGEFVFTIDIFTTDAFALAYRKNDFPVHYYESQEIYLQLAVNSTLSIALFAENCYATPSGDPRDPIRYDLLKDGCPIDPTWRSYRNFLKKNQFSFTVFNFIGNFHQVFVHCDVIVCKVGEPNTRCKQGCLRTGGGSARRRRSALEDTVQSEVHTVSRGPLVYGEPAERSPGVNLTQLLTPLAVVFAALFVGGSLIYHRRQQGHSGGYSRLPLEVSG